MMNLLLFLILFALTFAAFVPIILPLLLFMNELAFLEDSFVFKITIYLLMFFIIGLFTFPPIFNFFDSYGPFF